MRIRLEVHHAERDDYIFFFSFPRSAWERPCRRSASPPGAPRAFALWLGPFRVFYEHDDAERRDGGSHAERGNQD